MARPKTIINKAELAGILGLSRGRITQLSKREDFPSRPDGKIDRDRVVQWYRNLGLADRPKSGPKPKPGGRALLAAEPGSAQASDLIEDTTPPKGTLVYEQWRLTREKADREALDRQILEGTVLKREEVRAAWCGMIGAAKNKLMVIADELCDRLSSASDPVVCRELINVRIHRALSELAEYPRKSESE